MNQAAPPAATLTVAVCTRDRPEMLSDTLRALGGQDSGSIARILVIDQGRHDPVRIEPDSSHPRTKVVRDRGEGIGRARNLAIEHARTPWVVFLDDDCLPDRGWARRLADICAGHHDAGFVSGSIQADDRDASTLTAVGVQSVRRVTLRRGRWRTPPLAIGMGASFAVRRDVAQRLGGWDVRFGTGRHPFPAGEDFDFNYRFLRSGGVAYLSPELQVVHRQWRSLHELSRLHEGYLTGNAGAAIKHLRMGDLAGGVWLWLQLAWGVSYMSIGAVRSRSALHRHLALAQRRGLARGTLMALRQRW